MWVSMKSSIFLTFIQHFLFFTYLMLWIHSSFSSGVGAEMRYTMWFPSTTRPSASVLHAFISWPRLLGMYNSKQFLEQKERVKHHLINVWHICQHSSQKCNLTGFLGSSTSRILRFSNGMIPRGSLSWINEGINIENGYQHCIQN